MIVIFIALHCIISAVDGCIPTNSLILSSLILLSYRFLCIVLLLTVRLTGSGLQYEGRLEVYYNGTWGTVCDDYFGDVDATVACKSFGSGLIVHYAVTSSSSLSSYFI